MGAHKKVHIRKISRIPSVARRGRGVHGKPCTEEDVESMFQDFVPVRGAMRAPHDDRDPLAPIEIGDFIGVQGVEDMDGNEDAVARGVGVPVLDLLVGDADLDALRYQGREIGQGQGEKIALRGLE
jgi:hypothetical protein